MPVLNDNQVAPAKSIQASMSMTQANLLNSICDTSKEIPIHVLESPDMTIDLIREMVTARGDEIPYYYWRILTRNPSITWDIISSNPDLPWCYPFFVLNKHFSWAVVHQNPQINWKSCDSVESKYITWDEVIANLDIISYTNCDDTWRLLSQRWDLDINYVLANLDKPWDWYYISRHDTVTGEIMEAHPQIKWWPYSVMRKGRSWEFIKPYVKSELEQRDMYSRRDDEYYDIPMEVCNAIADNPNITWDVIRNDPFLYSEIWWLSHSNAITWSVVCEHPDLDWDWSAITEKDEITMEIVKANLDKPWDWWTISKKVASLYDINEHPEYPWAWDEVSCRQDLTDIYTSTPRPWNWKTALASLNQRSFK